MIRRLVARVRCAVSLTRYSAALVDAQQALADAKRALALAVKERNAKAEELRRVRRMLSLLLLALFFSDPPRCAWCCSADHTDATCSDRRRKLGGRA